MPDRPSRRQGRRKAAPSTRSSDPLPPPQVMSKAAADAKRPRSPFLMPPAGSSGAGDDRYNLEGTDWSEIPTWRQTSFFGLRARGQFFVFVVDQSGSMIDDDRLTRAKIELLRSVFALQPPQRFEVIFFNEEATPMPGGPLPRPADLKTKNQLTSWLHLIGPDGGTDPRPAMAQALCPSARCRVPSFRWRIPRGNRRARRQAEPSERSHPLRGHDRRPGRQPPPAHCPRQRRPVRLTPGHPSSHAVRGTAIVPERKGGNDGIPGKDPSIRTPEPTSISVVVQPPYLYPFFRVFRVFRGSSLRTTLR